MVTDWERTPRNKKEELTKIIQAETINEEEEEDIARKDNTSEVVSSSPDGNKNPVSDVAEPVPKLYYVVSSPWVNAWLAFAYASKTSPDPGPCNNEMLLSKDINKKCYVPREGMSRTRKGRKADYRHVTEETWQQICNLYPGSGPFIKVNFIEVGSRSALLLFQLF